MTSLNPRIDITVNADVTGTQDVNRAADAVDDLGQSAADAAPDAERLGDATSRAGQEAESAGGRFNTLSKAVGAVAAAAAVDALLGWVSQAADAANETQKWATRLGLTVEQLSAMEQSAQATGLSVEGFRDGLAVLNEYLGEFQTLGTGAAEDLTAVGISLDDIRDSSVTATDVLYKMADAFAATDNEAAKLFVSNSLLGSEGNAFVDYLNRGSAGLRELEEAARSSGNVLREDQAQAAAEAARNMREMQRETDALKQELALNFAPVLTSTVRFLLDGGEALAFWTRELTGVRQEVEKLSYDKLILEQQSLTDAIEKTRQKMEAARPAQEAAADGWVDIEGAMATAGTTQQDYRFELEKLEKQLAAVQERIKQYNEQNKETVAVQEKINAQIAKGKDAKLQDIELTDAAAQKTAFYSQQIALTKQKLEELDTQVEKNFITEEEYSLQKQALTARLEGLQRSLASVNDSWADGATVTERALAVSQKASATVQKVADAKLAEASAAYEVAQATADEADDVEALLKLKDVEARVSAEVAEAKRAEAEAAARVLVEKEREIAAVKEATDEQKAALEQVRATAEATAAAADEADKFAEAKKKEADAAHLAADASKENADATEQAAAATEGAGAAAESASEKNYLFSKSWFDLTDAATAYVDQMTASVRQQQYSETAAIRTAEAYAQLTAGFRAAQAEEAAFAAQLASVQAGLDAGGAEAVAAGRAFQGLTPPLNEFGFAVTAVGEQAVAQFRRMQAEVQALYESLSQANADLQARILEAQGREAEAEALRQQNKFLQEQLDYQNQLNEARASGGEEAIRLAEENLRLLEQAQALEEMKLQREQQQQRQSGSGSTTTTTTTSSATGFAPIDYNRMAEAVAFAVSRTPPVVHIDGMSFARQLDPYTKLFHRRTG